MHLGDKIRAFRELKNYTQEFVAQKIDISQQQYSYIEQRGIKENDKRFEKIAEVLGTTRENIQQFNSDKVFTQTNYDNSQGYMHLHCNFYQQSSELLSELKKQNELINRLLDRIGG